MSQIETSRIQAAVLQIPRGLFIMTSAHENMRSGVLTRWVQTCAIDPPQVMVAVEKGAPVEPLIRDSRSFALCQVAHNDRLLQRAFDLTPERGEDPFVTLPAGAGISGSPIVDRAVCYLECKVSRHLDLDTGHRLYVGHVIAGGILKPDCTPAVEIGEILKSDSGGESNRNGTAIDPLM